MSASAVTQMANQRGGTNPDSVLCRFLGSGVLQDDNENVCQGLKRHVPVSFFVCSVTGTNRGH